MGVHCHNCNIDVDIIDGPPGEIRCPICNTFLLNKNDPRYKDLISVIKTEHDMQVAGALFQEVQNLEAAEKHYAAFEEVMKDLNTSNKK